MTQRSRQISTITLLFCFLGPLGFTYIVLKVRQYQVKEQVKKKIIQGIDKGDLLELTFSLEDSERLDWEHEREFRYQGQSYDVVEKSVEGDSITYSVWWDKIETKINNQLTWLVSKALSNDRSQKENQHRLDQFFKTLFIITKNSERVDSKSIVRIESWEQESHYHSLHFAPTAPPPIV